MFDFLQVLKKFSYKRKLFLAHDVDLQAWHKDDHTCAHSGMVIPGVKEGKDSKKEKAKNVAK